MIRVVHRGIGGAGTPGTVPKFTGTAEVADSPLSVSDGELAIAPSSIAGEGGQIDLFGEGAHATWVWDTYFGGLRWYTGGIIKLSLDALGALTAALKMSALEFWIGADLVLNSSGSTLRVAADATWTIVEVWAAGVARWRARAAQWEPLADDAYDLGNVTPNRVRNLYLAGEVVGANGIRNVGPQAAFANVQTNITGLTLAVGATETWVLDLVFQVTMVGVGGVKFYFTAPVATGGWFVRQGHIGSAVTWQSHWQNINIGVPGAPFYCTFAGAGVYTVRATIQSGVNPGTVQVVGITSAAGITCAVERANMLAHRIS